MAVSVAERSKVLYRKCSSLTVKSTMFSIQAHDFMDYDPSDLSGGSQMGQDGCIDWDHPANAGLPGLWCDDCALTEIYNVYAGEPYFLSRADFWVAAANAVIHITSPEGEKLDLASTFRFGRVDAETCADSALRLPESGSCSEVERVFPRMGLSWTGNCNIGCFPVISTCAYLPI